MYLVLGRLTGKYSEDFESVALDESDSASDQVITANRVDFNFHESYACNRPVVPLDCLSNSLK